MNGPTEAPDRAVAVLAHDLGNHLQVAASALRLLDRRTSALLDDEGRSLAYAAAKSLERAIRLGGLLVRPVALSKAVASPIDVVRRIVRSVGLSQPNSIEVEVDVLRAPPCLSCDPAGLEDALLNLARNACDAMPDGGVLRLSVMGEPLVQGVPPRALISVADTGHGMDVATAKRACQPFFTTKAPGRGTGLGLPSVAAFASLYGGDLRIRSAPGLGTVVEVRLPIA